MYIYDISETPRLEKILTGSSRTINAIAWNLHDPNSIAMTVSEDENNVLIWDLAAEALAKRLSAIGPAAKHVAWCAHSSARSRTHGRTLPPTPLHARRSAHHAGELVTASQYGVLTRITVHNGAREEVPWASRQYGGSLSVPPTSTLAKATAPGHNLLRALVVCLRLSPRVPSRYCLALDCGIVLVLTDGHVTMDVPHKGEVCADCQWDPLSDNYLLVGCVSGTRFQPPGCSLACAYCLYDWLRLHTALLLLLLLSFTQARSTCTTSRASSRYRPSTRRKRAAA